MNAFAISPAAIKKIQKALDTQTGNKTHVGISVGLIEGDEKVIINSGYRDLKNKIPLNDNDYFSIGSVSKTFTSLLLSVAVERGLVTIDEKVKNLIPEFSGNRAGEITLRELSTHTSGLQRDPDQLSNTNVLLPFENYKSSQLIYEVLNAKYFEIKDKEKYSNLGIGLLSLCLEKIYQQDFDSAIYDYVLNPLGLRDILVNLEDDQKYLMSKKYFQSLDELPIWSKLGIMNGVGNFKATTKLMLKYIAAQLNPEQTSLENAIKRSQKALHKFSKESIGYAWFLLKKPVGKLLFHNGSTAGFSTDVYIAPEKNKGLIILSNTRATVECVNAIFFFNKDCIPEIPLTDSERTLSELESIYQVVGFDFTISIVKKDNNVLTLYFADQKYGVRLFKTSQDTYHFFGDAGKVVFKRDESGIVKSLNFTQKTASSTVHYKASKI